MPKFISWIPTQLDFVDAFFELAPVSESDTVYDLGSGDGRLLLAALNKGAGKCIGIDIDPDRVNDGRNAAESKGCKDRVTFVEADVMDVDLSDASLVLCYLITAASAALKPKFAAELKPGARIVMESFPIPGWRPARTKETNGRVFYLYNIPPEVDESYQPTDTGSDYFYDS